MNRPYDKTTDYHCHILPSVDHGCENEEMCRAQLEYARNAGIKTVIATSHFYPQKELVTDFLIRRSEALGKAYPIAEKKGISIVPGAETLWCPGIEKMEGLEKLISNEKGFNHLLLELPFIEFDTDKAMKTIRVVHEKYGCNIILAHVERYEPKQILEFDYDFVGYQINARSFHKLSRRLKVNKYIKSGKVMACGSDIHGLENTYKYF